MPFKVKRNLKDHMSRAEELLRMLVGCTKPKPGGQVECPVCHHKMELFSAVDGDCTEGDMTMCSKCGTQLVFKEDKTLREADLNDIMNMDEDMKKQMDLCAQVIKGYKGEQKHER
jgi:transcription elongation factor Elf1